MISSPLLELRNVTKKFPGVLALDKASFRVYRGRAMGLAGENGAGKSTLMKIIAGVYQKDEGEIFYKDKNVQFTQTTDSIDAGIGIIHQELNLLPELTVMENIFLGREPLKKFGKIDFKEMYSKSLSLLNKLGVSYDPTQKLKTLSLGAQQMVEIAKVLSQNAELIIMDEPTDSLTKKEIDNLFKVINDLKKENKGVVYISHRLDEFFEICEDVTVFRDGKYISENRTHEIDKDILVEKMVGRKLSDQFPHSETERGNNILQVNNLSNEYIDDISFTLKEGEVLGISGLVGSGRTELCKTIIGAIPLKTGSIQLRGNILKIKNVRSALKNKIFYVSEDRKKDGLILGMNIRENISLSSISDFEKFLFHINKKQEIKKIAEYVGEFKIKTPNQEQTVKNLSGGNQQKVSIAKGLLTNPDILILDEPTRGIDIGAKRDIYFLINELKKSGLAILLVSSEMSEIIGLSDRIIVMSNGKLNGEFSKEEVTQEKLLQAAIGL